jgi:hypothetical protein
VYPEVPKIWEKRVKPILAKIKSTWMTNEDASFVIDYQRLVKVKGKGKIESFDTLLFGTQREE